MTELLQAQVRSIGERLFPCLDLDHVIIKGKAIQRGRQTISIGEPVKGVRLS